MSPMKFTDGEVELIAKISYGAMREFVYYITKDWLSVWNRLSQKTKRLYVGASQQILDGCTLKELTHCDEPLCKISNYLFYTVAKRVIDSLYQL